AALLLAVLLMVIRPWSIRSAAHDHAAASGSRPSLPPAEKLPPAANLRIRVGASQATGETLLEAAADAWNQAVATAIHLNRTPRIYQTEPVQERAIPRCEVRALRTG